jgi:hypothetical protein
MITRCAFPGLSDEKVQGRLRDRSIADPAARLAARAGDLDASLAEAVTLSVDDIALSGLLDRLGVTAGRRTGDGAAVYRVPVDDTALVFQAGQPAERPADPERAARIGPVQQALREAVGRSEGGRISVEDTELSAEEYARYQADVAEASRPPVQAPDGLAAAVAAARAAGLLAPVARGASLGGISCTGGRPGPSPRSAPTPPGTPTSGRRHSGTGGSPPSRKAAKTPSTSSWRPATTITPPGRTTRRWQPTMRL